MLDEKEFQKLKIQLKIKQLQTHGELVAQRNYLRYEVHLYCYHNFFVEVWRTLAFGDVFSIDVAPKRSIKEAYLNVIDLKKLGLDL